MKITLDKNTITLGRKEDALQFAKENRTTKTGISG